MKKLLKGLLPALMVSLIVSSCSKEPTVVLPKDTKQSQYAQPLVPTAPAPLHISKYRIFYDFYWHGGPPSRRFTGCFSIGGNCLKKVVIKSTKLNQQLSGGSANIANYFSGNEWQEHFTEEVITDLDFINFMQSGTVQVKAEECKGEEGETYYYLGTNNPTELNSENARYIIPIQ